MALLVPLGLCLVALVIAALPPADVRPAEEPIRWCRMAIATLTVLGVLAVAMHRLHQNDPTARVDSNQLAGDLTPSRLRVFALVPPREGAHHR